MRILIISDTHGRNSRLDEVWDVEKDVDMVIHLGDIEGGEIYLDRLYYCPIHMVKGNNDYFSDLPMEKEIKIGKYRVLITHGHQYGVSMGPDHLITEGKLRGVDIVMHGHTHRPYLDSRSGIIALNPGSLTYPRQEGRRPAYMVMNINSAGELSFEQKYL